VRSSPSNRAIVAAAVRYTFIDTSSAYDDLIAPIIVDFLSLMHDENLVRLHLLSLPTTLMISDCPPTFSCLSQRGDPE